MFSRSTELAVGAGGMVPIFSLVNRFCFGGGRVVRWCWVNFQCQGVLLIWIVVGQGPAALAVGTCGVVWTFFSRLLFLFFLPLSGRRPDID